jgi:hypothetical protein
MAQLTKQISSPGFSQEGQPKDGMIYSSSSEKSESIGRQDLSSKEIKRIIEMLSQN